MTSTSLVGPARRAGRNAAHLLNGWFKVPSVPDVPDVLSAANNPMKKFLNFF